MNRIHSVSRQSFAVQSLRRIGLLLMASASWSSCAFVGWDDLGAWGVHPPTKPPTAAGSGAPNPPAMNPNQDGSYGPLQVRADETCYEFKTHGSTTSVDDTPFDVGLGDHVEQFYFRAPWPTGSVATGYATLTDNTKVLHHWFLFSTSEDQPEGFHAETPLPTLIGTNPVLLAMWGAGGSNLVAPDDVGFELPPQGAQLNLQWTYNNITGQPQRDASVLQVCVTPGSKRPHVAGITWLGTEDLNGNVWFGGAGMPAHQVSTFSSTCVPGRAGLGASDPIHILGFEPHMNALGARMQTEVMHANGTHETLFDQPFSFGSERHAFKRYDLLPGERLTTRCTFDNTTDLGVPFGATSDTEMCYQFAFAYPAHALANQAASLLGANDSCW